MFFSEVFIPDTIIVPQPALDYVVIDLALVANDTDSPKIGVGEIAFEEISEDRDGTGKLDLTLRMDVMRTSVSTAHLCSRMCISPKTDNSARISVPCSDIMSILKVG